jgi:hypothetical protein
MESGINSDPQTIQELLTAQWEHTIAETSRDMRQEGDE